MKETKYFQFMAAGLPAFLIALPLNYCLVTEIGLGIPVSYAVTLSFQVTLNFLIIYFIVFRSWKNFLILLKDFLFFISGIAIFRLGEWGIYVISTWYLPEWYLKFQVINMLLFSLIKYKFSKQIFSA